MLDEFGHPGRIRETGSENAPMKNSTNYMNLIKSVIFGEELGELHNDITGLKGLPRLFPKKTRHTVHNCMICLKLQTPGDFKQQR